MAGELKGVLNLLAGQVKILVTPEVLQSKSAEVSKNVSDMMIHFTELKNLVDKTESYWIGDGGDVHRKHYRELVDEVDEILRRLGEHPKDLLTIASGYSAAEAKVQEISQSLPGDVIV